VARCRLAVRVLSHLLLLRSAGRFFVAESKLGGLSSASTVNNRRCGRRQGREPVGERNSGAPGPSLATRLLPRLIRPAGSKVGE